MVVLLIAGRLVLPLHIVAMCVLYVAVADCWTVAVLRSLFAGHFYCLLLWQLLIKLLLLLLLRAGRYCVSAGTAVYFSHQRRMPGVCGAKNCMLYPLWVSLGLPLDPDHNRKSTNTMALR